MTVDIRIGAAHELRGPAVGMLGQFAVLGVVAAGVGLGTAGWLAGVTYALVTRVALTEALHRAGARSLGPANAVTLARGTLVGGVTALVVDLLGRPVPAATAAVLVALAAVALLLDGVDGQVARRTGTSSPLGARFDMEIDAFLILVLSALVAGSLGAWVLAIGLFRYVFVVAGWWLTWLRGALPPRFSRKTVAALQGIVLVVASAGVVAAPVMSVVVGAALALLGWSFGRDVHWLWRARPRRGARTAVQPGLAVGSHQRQDVPQAPGAGRGRPG